MARLISQIVPGDWNSVAQAIRQLDAKLNTNAKPVFSAASITGLLPSRLVGTTPGGTLASADLSAFIAGTQDEIIVTDNGDGTVTLSLGDIGGTVDPGDIDHDALLNTHNLTTDIDHNAITNTHNLTTDIDHDQLTNTHDLTTDIDHNEITNTHNLTTDIDHGTIANTHNLTTDIDHDQLTNTHNLTTDIDHDQLTNFVANEHIDWTNATNALLTTGAVTVGGAADTAQLVVKINASQTASNPAIKVVDSAGDELFRVTSDHSTNLFIGNQAGYSNNAAGGATQNVFIGDRAGYSNTTGYNNFALGPRALFSNTTGNENFAIGVGALMNLDGGTRNFAVGLLALHNSVTGTDNFAFGNNTLYATLGSNNLAFGRGAAGNLVNGSFNIFMGASAGWGPTNWNGDANVIIGFEAAFQASGTAHRNVVYGARAGRKLAANHNVFLGYAAGENTTGGSNVFIGFMAGYNETGSNKLYIENSSSASPLIYGEFNNDFVRINGDFEVTGSAVTLGNLPTTDPHVAGRLWNNGGTVAISAG